MSNKTRTVLVPRYMQTFKCIGSACEDTCCVGWGVSIDKETYKKYRNVDDPELRSTLNRTVKRNRSKPSDANYAKIKLESGSRCPLLAEDSLCTVHSKLGEDYLSTTCTTYPRVSNIINDTFEKSATMSCPEAARLALLNPELMVFDHVEEPIETRNAVNKKLDTANPLTPYKLETYFWELRVFTIQVLQNRNYSLIDRLIILGMFYQKAQAELAEGKMKELPQLIGKYTNLIEEGAFDQSLKDIPSQLNIQTQFLKALVDIRFIQGTNSERYLDCLKEFLKGLEYKPESTLEEIISNYEDAYANYYAPFMDKHEYILENYLVNYVFKNMFPLSNEKQLFDDYVTMILHYALIKLHLIGMARYHKELNTDHVIKLIQSFAKVVEHNKAYMTKIMKILKDNDYTSMAYMAILIKN